MKTKEQKFRIEGFEIKLTSDYDPNSSSETFQLLDTKVEIDGKYLCTIAGNTISSFISGFSQLIDEHRI